MSSVYGYASCIRYPFPVGRLYVRHCTRRTHSCLCLSSPGLVPGLPWVSFSPSFADEGVGL